MHFRTIAATAALSLAAIITVGADSYTLVFELRVPKTVTIDKRTDYQIVTESSASSTKSMRDMKQREAGDYRIFHHSDDLSNDRRRALIIDSRPSPSQVFVLHIPSQPKVSDWSQWQRPDYIADWTASWDFMYDQQIRGRSTNIPPDCFQLRYKVERSDAP